MKHFSYMMLCALLLALTSCGVVSDSETEKMIEGSWECVQYETEDGARMKISEEITYYADTHLFQSELNISIVSPIKAHLATVKYSGTWRATKEELIGEIEPKSISTSHNTKYLDRSDMLELRRDLLGETERSYDGGKILSLTDDSLEIEDDEGDIFTYSRIVKLAVPEKED